MQVGAREILEYLRGKVLEDGQVLHLQLESSIEQLRIPRFGCRARLAEDGRLVGIGLIGARHGRLERAVIVVVERLLLLLVVILMMVLSAMGQGGGVMHQEVRRVRTGWLAVGCVASGVVVEQGNASIDRVAVLMLRREIVCATSLVGIPSQLNVGSAGEGSFTQLVVEMEPWRAVSLAACLCRVHSSRWCGLLRISTRLWPRRILPVGGHVARRP